MRGPQRGLVVAACVTVVLADVYVAVVEGVDVAALYLVLIVPLLALTVLPLLLRDPRNAAVACRGGGAALLALGVALAIAALFLLVVPGVLLLAASVGRQPASRG